MTGRAERKQRTREELIAAARGVIADKGFPATTARDVAEAAGVAVGTVFVHFPTMARLAETLLDETVGAALESAAATLPASGLIDRLMHVSECLYAAYRADEALSRQVVSASLFEAAPDGPSRRRMADFRAWVGTWVEAAVDADEIAPLPVDEAFAGFFALYFGVLAGGLRGELDARAQSVMLRRLLVRLLQPAGERA